MKKVIFGIISIIIVILFFYKNEKYEDFILKTNLPVNNTIGSIDFVEINNGIKIDSNNYSKNMTISFWVFPYENYNWTTLLSVGNINEYIQLSSKGNPNGEDIGLNLTFFQNGEQTRLISSKTDTLLLQQYNHIVITRKDNFYSLYLNGNLIGESKVNTNKSTLNDYEMKIGYSEIFDDPKFVGKISDLYINSFAFEESRVKILYLEKKLDFCMDAAKIYENMSDDIDFDFSKINRFYVCHDIDKRWEYDQSAIDHFEEENVIFNESAINADQLLKLNLKYQDEEKNIEFKFHNVSKTDREKFEDDKNSIIENFKRVIFSEDMLPTTLKNGTLIEWSEDTRDLEIVSNQLFKNSNLEIQATLSAKLVLNDIKEDIHFNVKVLDKSYAYIMAYFTEDYGSKTAIDLAYSLDGLHWNKLTNEKTNIKSSIDESSQQLRDPFLFRKNDGSFVLLATQGWDNPEIYYWDSNDLVDYSNNRLIKVGYFEPGISMTGDRAWAPEIVYSGLMDSYIITFSDPFAGPIYAVKTKDFNSINYPFIFFDPGYEVIDATFLRNFENNLMFYKDERTGVLTLLSCLSETLDFNNPKVFDYSFISNQRYLEGPFVVTNSFKSYLYADSYKEGKFLVYEIIDPINYKYELLNNDEYSLPEDYVRHGSTIQITRNELEKILRSFE